MRIIQVYNNEGEKVGLYQTVRNDDQVDQEIVDAFAMGEARKEHYEEMEYEEVIDPQTEADECLEKTHINRVYMDEVYI